MPGNKVTPIAVAESVDVSEDQAASVLDYLITNGWMNGNLVQFNMRSTGNLELPQV